MTTPAVASWSLERHAGGLGRTVESARGRWVQREGLTLRLMDCDGHVGLGEAAPLPPYSQESIDDCEAALRAAATGLEELHAPVADALAGFAAGLDPGQAFRAGERPPDRVRGLDAPPLACVRLASYLAPLRAARFAMETALLDLAARRDGVSVSALLAGNAVRDRVERSGLLAAADDLDGAHRLIAANLRTLKVKVGIRPFEEELADLKRLRNTLPADTTLRLDAGGAWDIETARERLARLAAEIAPELCEEPTGDTGMLALGNTAVPWAPDESLAIPGLAERLLASPGCGAVVLKPALLGGLLPAYALARRAARHGVAAIVTHLFDGPVGLAAACELALALPGTVRPCGLDPHPGLAAWPAAELPQLRHPGLVVPSGLPGLGLTRYGES